LPTSKLSAYIVPGVVAIACATPVAELLPRPVRSSHCAPSAAGKVNPL